MANLNLKAGDNITLVKDGEDLEINSHQDETSEIIVSPTQPNTGEEVWLQKGKNLCDGKLVLGSYTNTGAPDSQTTTQYRNATPVPVQPNTTYTTSINGTAQKYVMVYYDENMGFISSGDNTTGTFTTPSNCYYVNFRCYNADFTNDFANLLVQFEQGSTATTYEAYVEKKIYTKNNNGVYEEFYDETNKDIYSTAETRIGNWIDGKPLYRKVITGTIDASNTAGTYKETYITYGNNVDETVDLKISATINTLNRKVFLPYTFQDNSSRIYLNSYGSNQAQFSNNTTYSASVTIIALYTKITE